MHKYTPSAATSAAFQKLQSMYGLQTPNQIKMKIMWMHIQHLILAQYPGKATTRNLAKFNRHWRTCEANETNLRT